VNGAELLRVEALKTWLDTPQGTVRAVDGVDLDLRRGEVLALLGESGCGKSMTALSLMRLVPEPAGYIAGGRVLLEGRELLDLTEIGMRRIRGGRMAMIFQEPMSSLNPVMTVGRQIGEVLRLHRGLRGAPARRRATELLQEVGLPDPPRRLDEYPHQLSGGMKQRVMIAIALAGAPELLIADEPTTALDVTIQAQILELLRRLQREHGMAMLLITHDLAVVRETADRVAVMYAGRIVERASRGELFRAPRHPYTRKLFESLPGTANRERPLSVIPGTVPALTRQFAGCRFADRCGYAWRACRETEPGWQREGGSEVLCHLYDPRFRERAPATSGELAGSAARAVVRATADGEGLLELSDLQVHFPIRRGVLQRVRGYVYAVDGVSLELRRGRTLALVGESGCGKTTLGRAVTRLLRPTGGRVLFGGMDLARVGGGALRARRKDFQMIFQDPFSSMDPRMMVGEVVMEGLRAQAVGKGTEERRARAAEMLRQVGLEADVMDRYPHEFSGGQRQRICIARALAVDPKLLVCDEPTSALDVSVQAQVLNLMRRLQAELALSYLFITHDMSVVGYMADEVAVMYLGRVVEQGSVRDVLERPAHPYTQALLAAAPTVEQSPRRPVIRLQGDPPSPASPPRGCHFRARCPHAMARCGETYPGVTPLGSGHRVRCFLHGG